MNTFSYFSQKAVTLNLALLENKLPPVCKPREHWNDKKCEKYCAASEHYPYAKGSCMKKKVVRIMPLTSQAEIKVVTLECNSQVNLVLPHIKTMVNTL